MPVVSAALASGTLFAQLEDRAADGPLAMQDAAPRSQRALHASRGLQPDPATDGRGGDAGGQSALDGELQRSAANDHEPAAAVEHSRCKRALAFREPFRHGLDRGGEVPCLAESEAESTTEKMALPVVLLFLGFLILIGYPAISLILTGL